MHTSSAVHIRIVFGQLRTFWNQLAWPDAETAYVFVSRILDDICKASVVYARKLVSKCAGNDNNTAVASGPHLAHRQEIGFSREQCHVVNNLEFVVDAIRPLPQVIEKRAQNVNIFQLAKPLDKDSSTPGRIALVHFLKLL